ncbi:MAG TPA: DUF5667 domain-containing protein [Candidatus Paceibacterota bacterium]|nr:DUF5667 domain-containing protein [Candidatus Paceibacterota bacterium]
MPNQFNQFIKYAKEVGMTSDEKSRIASHLHMVTAKEPVASFNLTSSPYFSAFSFSRIQVLVLAVFLVFGSASYAAQDSLPGDIFYPFKTKVNERVEGFFATNPAARAQHEAKLALVRLEEAEALGAEGKLSSSTQADLVADFNAHANGLENNLNEISDQNSDDQAYSIAMDFHNNLEIHRNILNQIARITPSESASNLNLLAGHIDLTLNSTETKLAAADNASTSIWAILSFASTTPHVVEVRLNRNDLRIADLKNSLAENANLSSDIQLSVADDLQTAIDLQAKAKAAFAADNYTEAFTDASKAADLLISSHNYLQSQIQVESLQNILNKKDHNNGMKLKVIENDQSNLDVKVNPISSKSGASSTNSDHSSKATSSNSGSSISASQSASVNLSVNGLPTEQAPPNSNVSVPLPPPAPIPLPIPPLNNSGSNSSLHI